MARPQRDVHSAVWDILKGLRGLDPLKELFWSVLNYERLNQPLSRRGWGKAATEALAEDPVLFAAGGADRAFHIIYARVASDKLLFTPERAVVSRLLRDHPYCLFVFSNDAQDRWHFLNVKYSEATEKRRLFRRITVGPEDRLRTASERIAMLDLATVGADLWGLSPLAIQNRHDEAFDVEAVTKQFYEEYKAVFGALWDDLERQTKDRHWAHDYALQFLNRLMFLYFVQRKGWLDKDPDFLARFWRAYVESGQPKDTFFERWLKVLFFEAFHKNRFQAGRHKHLPEDIRDALALAPYLNGGLFTRNDLDCRHNFNVTDNRFRQIFNFLERYNFTIAEDSPLDQEVAVDPEMIGKVYESLVNVSEEASERGEAGIFYTPRTEIDLMCRLALVDNLTNHLGEKHKDLFYEAVFALVPDEKEAADAALAKAGLWPAVDEHLRQLTVVDPACGSGSFLVGMLHVLDDLQARAAPHVGREESAYQRRKRIIGRNLYGVDVMEWACHVAELRLWLALIVDADLTPVQAHCPKDDKPLLPHFSFKVRCGDSLVQEVGGIQFSHRRSSADVPQAVKNRLRRLRKAKLAYYSGQPDPKLKTDAAIRREEVAVFRNLLAEQVKALDNQVKKLMRQQGGRPVTKAGLVGDDNVAHDDVRKIERARERRAEEIERLEEEKDRLEAARRALRSVGQVPFVWDIAFAEVLKSEAGGFDIVIGNPPYVRTESIADPRLPREKVTTAHKKAYKVKLARSVYQAWPRFFGYKPGPDTVGRRMDAKSDLYIYFYFHGLSLLAEKGSFCFITSNSWLDVGYGRDLQEFLLRHGHVRMVIDNEARRSFKEADVNTVIVLLARPDEGREDGLNQIARFVMFKVPFDEVLSPVIFQEIEDARDRRSTAEYRLCCLKQERLFEDGCELPEKPGSVVEERTAKKAPAPSHGPSIRVAKYIGNKWGGKYLRAPDIYWRLLEKAKGKLVRLGDIAEVQRGFTTGANEFFYLDTIAQRQWNIEAQFLKPLLKSTRQLPSRIFNPHELSLKCFWCHEALQRLKNTRALRYIQHGVSCGIPKRPTLRGRKPRWYSLPARTARLVMVRATSDRPAIYLAEDEVLHDQTFYSILPGNCVQACSYTALAGALNATLSCYLSREVLGGAGGALGLGAQWLTVYEAKQIPCLAPDVIAANASALEGAVKELGRSKPKSLCEELSDEARLKLDNIIFDILGASQTEREAVYEAVLKLVEARLSKAESLNA